MSISNVGSLFTLHHWQCLTRVKMIVHHGKRCLVWYIWLSARALWIGAWRGCHSLAHNGSWLAEATAAPGAFRWLCISRNQAGRWAWPQWGLMGLHGSFPIQAISQFERTDTLGLQRTIFHDFPKNDPYQKRIPFSSTASQLSQGWCWDDPNLPWMRTPAKDGNFPVLIMRDHAKFPEWWEFGSNISSWMVIRELVMMNSSHPTPILGMLRLQFLGPCDSQPRNALHLPWGAAQAAAELRKAADRQRGCGAPGE